MIMADHGKQQRRRSSEDAVFNRMLFWLVGAVAAEAVALIVKRLYIDFRVGDVETAVALRGIFHVFSYAGAVLLAAGLIWCLAVRGKKSGFRPALACTVAVGFLWLTALLSYLLYDVGVRILVALPIVAAVLILIWFLYQHVFFFNAVVTGCALALLWLYRQYYTGHPTAVLALFAVGWVLLAALASAAAILRKNGGRLGKHTLPQSGSAYVSTWLTCAVSAAALLAALLAGMAAAYYLIYVLIGWIFCLAVFYTVKMM